jgi:hypothetical protein
MRGQTLKIFTPVEIVTEECPSCGVIFGLTSQHRDERVKDHRLFYCTNGHSQHYTGESEAEKNARLLREEQARHQRTIARENEERMAKEKLARKLKRVDRGVCPECNRTFTNLARHMHCKHGGADLTFGKRKLPA